MTNSGVGVDCFSGKLEVSGGGFREEEEQQQYKQE